MNYRRVVVPGVVAVVAVTAVVFGPLVAGVSLANDSQTFAQDGTIRLDSASLPSEGTIESADYGAANYYLTVPSTTVEFAAVEGSPTLVYLLQIEALGMQRSTNHFLDSSVTSPFEVTMESATLDRTFDQSEYDARLSLAVRNESGQYPLAERNITVRVEE